MTQRICANCGKEFTIMGRIDTLYCDRCKLIGPVNKWEGNLDPLRKVHRRRCKTMIARKKSNNYGITEAEYYAWKAKADELLQKARTDNIPPDEFEKLLKSID